MVRIPERKERERAFEVLLDVDEAWVSIPGNLYGLSSRQVKALQDGGIAFEWVSKAPPHA
jgi:hypothetical protein